MNNDSIGRESIIPEVTDEMLTEIYNEANGIKDGKQPPISTKRIFIAMRMAMQIGLEAI